VPIGMTTVGFGRVFRGGPRREGCDDATLAMNKTTNSKITQRPRRYGVEYVNMRHSLDNSSLDASRLVAASTGWRLFARCTNEPTARASPLERVERTVNSQWKRQLSQAEYVGNTWWPRSQRLLAEVAQSLQTLPAMRNRPGAKGSGIFFRPRAMTVRFYTLLARGLKRLPTLAVRPFFFPKKARRE
jgi:hypothetical protein